MQSLSKTLNGHKLWDSLLLCAWQQCAAFSFLSQSGSQYVHPPLSGLAKHCVQTVHKIKKSEPFALLRTASVCFLFQVLEVWYIILKYNKWVWYIIAFSGEQNLFCNALQTSVFSSVVRNESEPFVYSFSLFFAFRRWKYDISHLSTIYEYDIS